MKKSKEWQCTSLIKTDFSINLVSNGSYISGGNSITFSLDGKFIISYMYIFKKIIIFDVETSNRKYLLDGHLLDTNSIRQCHDGKLLSLNSSRFDLYPTWVNSNKESSLVKVKYDKKIYDLFLRHIWNGQTLSYSHDGKFIAYGANGANVYVCNLEFINQNIKLEVEDNLIYPNSIQFSTDEIHIAVGSADKTIRIWNRYSGKEKNKNGRP